MNMGELQCIEDLEERHMGDGGFILRLSKRQVSRVLDGAIMCDPQTVFRTC